jgi:ATP-dependent RNA helicase DHX37/DHR1
VRPRYVRNKICTISLRDVADTCYVLTVRTQLKVIRQLLTAAFVDQVAIRKDLVTPSTPDYAKVSSTRGVPYQAVGVDEDVYIHPSSVVFHGAPPEAVVFQELIRTSRPFIRSE